VETPDNRDSYYCILIKGASEKIWTMCGSIIMEGGRLEMIG
jgi:hypothetical protein